MTDQVTNRRKRVMWALLLAGLSSVGAAVYWVNQNYDVRLVRRDAELLPVATTDPVIASAARKLPANTNKPPPIVVRLACVDAGAAVRGLQSPSRSLRQQLKQGDRKAPTPLPDKRCKPRNASLVGFNSRATQVVGS